MNPWFGRYIGHLETIGGLREGYRPDTGALAELRSAARGGPFEIRALRHVVPYLSDDRPATARDTKVALIVGHLFASHPPEGIQASAGRSVGRLLGLVDAKMLNRSGAMPDPKRPTALERHLQTLVAAPLDQLSAKLRGSFARIASEGVAPTSGDYAQLLSDLTYWDSPERRVQYRWVGQFYVARSVETKSEEGEAHE